MGSRPLFSQGWTRLGSSDVKDRPKNLLGLLPIKEAGILGC